MSSLISPRQHWHMRRKAIKLHSSPTWRATNDLLLHLQLHSVVDETIKSRRPGHSPLAMRRSFTPPHGSSWHCQALLASRTTSSMRRQNQYGPARVSISVCPATLQLRLGRNLATKISGLKATYPLLSFLPVFINKPI